MEFLQVGLSIGPLVGLSVCLCVEKSFKALKWQNKAMTRKVKFHEELQRL